MPCGVLLCRLCAGFGNMALGALHRVLDIGFIDNVIAIKNVIRFVAANLLGSLPRHACTVHI